VGFGGGSLTGEGAMEPFSMDLRKRVVAFIEAGHSKKEASRHFDVSYGFVKKLFARLRTLGTLEPGHAPGAMPKLNESQQQQLTEMVRQQPDATLAELRDQIREVCGVELSVSGVDVWLKRLGLSFKKSRSVLPSRIGKTSPEPVGCGG
jgi:transposase